jgi:hypothetical protein
MEAHERALQEEEAALAAEEAESRVAEDEIARLEREVGESLEEQARLESAAAQLWDETHRKERDQAAAEAAERDLLAKETSDMENIRGRLENAQRELSTKRVAAEEPKPAAAQPSRSCDTCRIA